MSAVSVLIPCFNAAEWIAEAIISAQSQTWKDIEIIVVDDGSTDRSYEIAKRFEDSRTTILRQENRGPGAARNRAFAESTGPVIQYLDADDLLHPRKIEAQMQVLNGSGEELLLFGRWGRFEYHIADSGLEQPPPQSAMSPMEWLHYTVSSGDMVPTHAWLARRRLIEEAGPWDERLTLHDDAEFFCRLALKSDGVRFIKDAICYYRTSNRESVSRKRDDTATESFYLVASLIADHILEAEDSPRTRKIAAAWLGSFLYHADGTSAIAEAAVTKRLAYLGMNRLPIGTVGLRVLCRALGTKRALLFRRKVREKLSFDTHSGRDR